MSLVVIGLNTASAPLELLEQMTIDDSRVVKALDDLVGRPHVTEAVVLSTCNRTEVYAYVEKFHGAYSDVRGFLAEQTFLPPEAFSDHLYVHYDTDAVRHLFSVAAGLDSAVLGEHEVLGQVRRAWEIAQEARAAGPVLAPLFRHAVETGKRVRTETAIGRGVASVSHAAVAMAGERLGGLAGRSVLVLGAGEMAEGMAASLRESGVASIAVANRTWDRAVDLASRVDGTPVRLADVADSLTAVDVALTSTGATAMLLESGDLAEVMARRAGRPLLIVDIAVPRDVDPSAGALPGVTLLDMDDVRAFAEAGRAGRRREIAAVEEIVGQELERYRTYATAREVAPLVAALHGKAEAIRDAELARFAGRLASLGERDRATVEAIVQGVIGKLLYHPTVRLKDAAGTARGERLAEVLRDLFEL